MAVKKSGLGKGLDSLIADKGVKPVAKPAPSAQLPKIIAIAISIIKFLHLYNYFIYFVLIFSSFSVHINQH